MRRSNDIDDKASGVDSHNALGNNEKYHLFSRDIYNKVVTENYTINSNIALSAAVRAVPDTAGPPRLVPTLLVYGAMPRFPVSPVALPERAIRMRALINARKEMTKPSGRARFETALRKFAPSASDNNVDIRNEVSRCPKLPIGNGSGQTS